MTALVLNVILTICFGTMTLSLHAQEKKPTPAPIVIGKGSGALSHTKGESNRIPKIFEIDFDTAAYDWGSIDFELALGGGKCSASFGASKENEKKGVSHRLFIRPGTTAKIEKIFNVYDFKEKNKIYVYVTLNYVPLFDETCTNTYDFTVYLKNYQKYIPPTPYPGALGNVDYYDFRYKDFLRRNPGRTPPDYYKGYGEKNFSRFMKETYPAVSEDGKTFLKVVGRALQQKIENRLKEDPRKFAALERGSDNFRNFAYETHVRAYCESGWGKLTQSDRDKVVESIDWSDKYLDWNINKSFHAILTGTKILYECGSIRDVVP